MRILKLAILPFLISNQLAAQGIEVAGTVTHTIVNNNTSNQLTKTEPSKEIRLLKIKLSNKEKELLNLRVKNLKELNNYNIKSKGPLQIQLGMNNVPVLDQGRHGTCVTFAVTAAMNAALNQGDYISQLCQLQLGNYLAENGYNFSGWDGSLGRTVINQMETFGIVNKEQEANVGCGGLNKYPHGGDDPTTAMSPEEFHRISEPLNPERVQSFPILDPYQAFNERVDINKTLTEVKKALLAGDRVTFAVLLVDYDLGTVGAVGSKNTLNDTWVLTPVIARDVWLKSEFVAGHEMVITGFDDNAVAKDDEGNKHKGLLTLRNSWGKNLGDKGDFYMSYDYFKVLAFEAQRIKAIESEEF
ncbi:cysteine protease, papain C1 family [Legionella busanensis]|uniref:Cysteine protease, papain C1 family n=1 Tax=Legionella busanensis TaxID=190655 RepID=A0A378JIU5_9GAMM|nr:C1 family peptidase [Legionella busanensis]STX51226.1 cysteine protease, papain C1 family [Legionella busanensis]